MTSQRRRPKERIGFGAAKRGRDHTGTLVVEETHFPAWLCWSCLSALGCGMVARDGLPWGGLSWVASPNHPTT